MSLMRPGALPEMTCEEATELAGLYVLDALDVAERDAVTLHLAMCAEAHKEMESLGGVVPALAAMAEPVDAPAALKDRVMAAYERDQAKPWTLVTPERALPAATIRPRETRSEGQGWRLPAWASWGAAIAAVLVVAVVGVWAVGIQSRADRANQRAQQLSDAVALLAEPGSSVAYVRGTGTDPASAEIRGFSVFPASGSGYMVMVGLPKASSTQTYQAWYLVDGKPSSAGLMTVEDDGYAVLSGVQPPAGTNLVAVTLEPSGGSPLPTSDPIAAGEVRAPA